MYEVYKIKNMDQPYNRKFIGEFKTVDEIFKILDLPIEDKIEALISLASYNEWIDDRGFAIERTMQFLHDGLPEEEIAEKLGIAKSTVRVLVHRSIKKLKMAAGNNDLRELLIRAAKIRGCSEVKYTERVTIDV